ncbi:hypothetical protein PR003_g28601 [Phytophthora rubi]|uniref:Reverse transcriptase Ty1/copia-type domain-containing protein n=1 Tax=Phytophthora rubi TaxID=129364 RepID=A0A6A4BXP8_9STRA|nr:hypothetical protein PR003_g28601 [Phytophthora rubi]
MAAAMMIESSLPHYLWEEALQHAAYIRNRVLPKTSPVTPHERIFNAKPDLTRLLIFGQALVMRIPDQARRKHLRFYGRGSIGAFVGFSEEIKGYKVYIPGAGGRSIKETADITPLDTMLHETVELNDADDTPPDGGGASPSEENEHHAGLTEVVHRDAQARRRLRDTTLTPQEVAAINGTSDLTRRRRSERISARALTPAFLCFTGIIREPLNIAEARRSVQWPQWKRAMEAEIAALKANDTFELVDPPLGANILANTVQFRLKTGPDGDITQFKARVCARGDRQLYLLDYVETHAPVADLVCVRIFHYGLRPTAGDACLYYLHNRDGLLLVCLYVDDLLIAHKNANIVKNLMEALKKKFQVKNLGTPSQFLGTRIERPRAGTILLSQRAYIDELPFRFAMDPVRPVSTPMVPKTRLDSLSSKPSSDELKFMTTVPYRSPRHTAAPRKEAWDSAKFLMRYLSGTRDVKLKLEPKLSEGLRLATDADWANDLEDRKSVSGFVLFLFGAPVAWGTTKQTVVAHSSTAAEFIAANDGMQQAEWIKLVVEEILRQSKIDLTLLVDSQPAIKRIQKEGSSGAQKAVDIRFHAIKDAWRQGGMTMEYLPTHRNPADLLTKALSRPELANKRSLCGLITHTS